MAADGSLGRRRVEDGRALSSSPRGSLLVGAVTGLIGDTLERDGSDLHEPMSVRIGGRPIELAPEPSRRRSPSRRAGWSCSRTG